jgi:tripartite-type tricarboxylate transporter receptor subunit TctC
LSTDYFSDKTITVQVPSGSGGTYHVYCQLVQRNLAKYIPGKLKILIQNRPGSGGAKSASYIANVVPKDGSGIAMIATGTITTPLIRKVKFDAHKFVWLCPPRLVPQRSGSRMVTASKPSMTRKRKKSRLQRSGSPQPVPFFHDSRIHC